MNPSRIIRYAVFCALALTFAVEPTAVRASTTSTLTVTASIANNCVLNASTATVAFGAYDPIVTNKTAALSTTYSPSYTCTSGDAAFTWAFTSPNELSGSCYMKSGSNSLAYTISDGTNSYCTGTAHAFAGETAATGLSQSNLSFAFSIAAGQNEPAGTTYTDTVTLTIAP